MSRLILVLALLAACGPSLEDQENKARTALNARDWAAATAAADEALANPKADDAAGWRLNQIKLDAAASSGKGSETSILIEALASKYPAQVKAPLYRSLADKSKAAGDNMGAIDILAAGDKRFPEEHDQFVAAIDALKNASQDPAEIEKLKALGYIN